MTIAVTVFRWEERKEPRITAGRLGLCPDVAALRSYAVSGSGRYERQHQGARSIERPFDPPMTWSNGRSSSDPSDAPAGFGA